MDWLTHLADFWPHLVAGFSILASLLASVHAVTNKRDPRAAVLWLGFIWFLPLVGPVLYLAMGVNRIRRRARSLRPRTEADASRARPVPEDMGETDRVEAEHLRMLARVVDRVATRPLVAGNQVRPLVNGDAAFPEMLAAIDGATASVALATYIFDNDSSGREFVDALRRAVGRGVAVRVLIDDTGARYSRPSIVRELNRAGVTVVRFLPGLSPWRLMNLNLRNHRKLLVVDGRIGFTGGINIRHGNRLQAHPRSPVQDLHFRLEGPVVAQLQDAFADDWAFSTREELAGPRWFPELGDRGQVIARVISDGPDADFEKARWTLLGALACARSSVQILTPYFLPDAGLVAALNLAALRGVAVDILLPGRSNLPFVHWASRAMWWQMLERGCRIWLTPPPFDHSKLMIVDGHWVFFGSANWDARSLRLNFELNVEGYGREFASEMEAIIQEKLRGATQARLEDVDGRSLPARVRDGVARLFAPYL